MGKRFVRTWTTKSECHRLCLEHIDFVNEEFAKNPARVRIHFMSGEAVTLDKERYEMDVLPFLMTIAESTEQLVELNQSLQALISFARSMDERDVHRFARGK